MSEPGLRMILSRLLLREQVGLLQKAPPPVPIFSPADSASLAPALRKAFQTARPSKWIAFVLKGTGPEGPTMTSGGLFIRDRHLHVLLANYRDPVSAGQDAREVEAHLLRPLKRRGRVLTFDGRVYLVSEQESWMGGSRYPPSGEVVPDYQAFLAAAAVPSAALLSGAAG